MNIPEGAYRMRIAGRWLTSVPLLAFVLINLWDILPALLHKPNLQVEFGLFETILLALPGGILWLSGWILEGFAGKE